MISVEHIRHHVVDDAGDLISLLGLLDPLIKSTRLNEADDIAHSGRILRRLLSRYLILVLCRLHERDGQGHVGRTASIDALLEIARGQVDEPRVGELLGKRLRIVAELEAEGIKFADLRCFRTAEIAHSVHRDSVESDNTLYYSTISAFARETYSLVLEIEQELAATGCVPFTDLPYLSEAWERRGLKIWEKALAATEKRS